MGSRTVWESGLSVLQVSWFQGLVVTVGKTLHAVSKGQTLRSEALQPAQCDAHPGPFGTASRGRAPGWQALRVVWPSPGFIDRVCPAPILHPQTLMSRRRSWRRRAQQGTPVQFRDGPAAVTGQDDRCHRCHCVSFPPSDMGGADVRRRQRRPGSQKTYQRSQERVIAARAAPRARPARARWHRKEPAESPRPWPTGSRLRLRQPVSGLSGRDRRR